MIAAVNFDVFGVSPQRDLPADVGEDIVPPGDGGADVALRYAGDVGREVEGFIKHKAGAQLGESNDGRKRFRRSGGDGALDECRAGVLGEDGSAVEPQDIVDLQINVESSALSDSSWDIDQVAGGVGFFAEDADRRGGDGG